MKLPSWAWWGLALIGLMILARRSSTAKAALEVARLEPFEPRGPMMPISLTGAHQ